MSLTSGRSATVFTALGVVLIAALSGCSSGTPQANTESSPPASGANSTSASPPASPSAAPLGATKVATTVHDNDSIFHFGPGVTSVGFRWDGAYIVTSGQPWEGVVVPTPTSSDLRVVARSGRSNSAPPARWFNERVTGTSTGSGADSRPSNLNFAFTGTITINGTAYPFTLGQGSSSAYNNWWVGGPGWTGTGPNSTVITPDGKYYLFPQNNANGFDVKVSK